MAKIMSSQVKDPFGGVLGESKATSPSPFKVDKEQALKDIQKSINIWDNKKIVRKSFLQKLREKSKSEEMYEKALIGITQESQKNMLIFI